MHPHPGSQLEFLHAQRQQEEPCGRPQEGPSSDCTAVRPDVESFTSTPPFLAHHQAPAAPGAGHHHQASLPGGNGVGIAPAAAIFLQQARAARLQACWQQGFAADNSCITSMLAALLKQAPRFPPAQQRQFLEGAFFRTFVPLRPDIFVPVRNPRNESVSDVVSGTGNQQSSTQRFYLRYDLEKERERNEHVLKQMKMMKKSNRADDPVDVCEQLMSYDDRHDSGEASDSLGLLENLRLLIPYYGDDELSGTQPVANENGGSLIIMNNQHQQQRGTTVDRLLPEQYDSSVLRRPLHPVSSAAFDFEAKQKWSGLYQQEGGFFGRGGWLYGADQRRDHRGEHVAVGVDRVEQAEMDYWSCSPSQLLCPPPREEAGQEAPNNVAPLDAMLIKTDLDEDDSTRKMKKTNRSIVKEQDGKSIMMLPVVPEEDILHQSLATHEASDSPASSLLVDSVGGVDSLLSFLSTVTVTISVYQEDVACRKEQAVDEQDYDSTRATITSLSGRDQLKLQEEDQREANTGRLRYSTDVEQVPDTVFPHSEITLITEDLAAAVGAAALTFSYDSDVASVVAHANDLLKEMSPASGGAYASSTKEKQVVGEQKNKYEQRAEQIVHVSWDENQSNCFKKSTPSAATTQSRTSTVSSGCLRKTTAALQGHDQEQTKTAPSRTTALMLWTHREADHPKKLWLLPPEAKCGVKYAYSPRSSTRIYELTSSGSLHFSIHLG
ncbi:unnamed protein product [Amoebophrya sp. A25]|nr:unnamed protein product [Amoebophrya sp. A25]|eukprot:GSA25T00004528001.1